MAKKPEEGIPTAEEAQKAQEKAGTSAVSVYDKVGGYVRTYSAERHGENFIKLAEGFARKIGGTVSK